MSVGFLAAWKMPIYLFFKKSYENIYTKVSLNVSAQLGEISPTKHSPVTSTFKKQNIAVP